MFSIVIPTYNNFKYFKKCVDSINKNSKHKHEIIVHVNDGSDGTIDYVKKENIKYTYSKNNIGLCSSINIAAKLCTTNYVLYSHDDMYFCPKWDQVLIDEITKIKHENFYICGTMIQPKGAHISLDCGDTIENFNENKLLENYKKYNYFDHQGSHFAPHIVTKNIWDDVGGFSEEFNPGIASDPDFNMKLWKKGIRIFKGLNNFKVYHFGSKTTRKNSEIKKNRGDITFLKKWGISVKFFKKFYLKTNTVYVGPLKEPNKNFYYILNYVINKLHYQIIKFLK